MHNSFRINHQNDAEKAYKFIQNTPFLASNSTFAVSQMTKACEKMNEDLEKIKDEQEEYEIELADNYAELLAEQAEIEEKMLALHKEIEELEQKEENGTITEDEKAELKNKRSELSSLFKASKQDEMNDLIAESERESRILNRKLNIAQDLGEVTLEKGQELADTKVKRATWFRKLFGITRRQKERKSVGQKAVEIAKKLIDTVKNFFKKEPVKIEEPAINVGQSIPNLNVNINVNLNTTPAAGPEQPVATPDTAPTAEAEQPVIAPDTAPVEANTTPETTTEIITDKIKKKEEGEA